MGARWKRINGRARRSHTTSPLLFPSVLPRAQLRENLDELGLDAPAIDALASELFLDDDDDDVIGVGGERLAGAIGRRAKAAAGRGRGRDRLAVVVDALPDDLTQEEIDAAEAEAQWLLNPLSMLDLSETKEKLMRMMAEGIAYQKAGQYANARSVYTRAIAMEAPNKRMTASLYYNRSACQRQLGQLKLALMDARRAYESDKEMLKAYWRAADTAIILDEQEDAREAIEFGLKVSPRCQPLLALKLKVQRF